MNRNQKCWFARVLILAFFYLVFPLKSGAMDNEGSVECCAPDEGCRVAKSDSGCNKWIDCKFCTTHGKSYCSEGGDCDHHLDELQANSIKPAPTLYMDTKTNLGMACHEEFIGGDKVLSGCYRVHLEPLIQNSSDTMMKQAIKLMDQLKAMTGMANSDSPVALPVSRQR